MNPKIVSLTTLHYTILSSLSQPFIFHYWLGVLVRVKECGPVSKIQVLRGLHMVYFGLIFRQSIHLLSGAFGFHLWCENDSTVKWAFSLSPVISQHCEWSSVLALTASSTVLVKGSSE